MSNYQYYTDSCAICGAKFPKRDMNKIMVSYGHVSAAYPRLVCHLCDNCLPTLFDYLAVLEPERKINWGSPPKECKKCHSYIGKTAVYCPKCGKKIEG